MKYLGPAASEPDHLVTLGEVQALLAGSGSAGGMGIRYGETKAIGKLLLSLGLINTAPVPIAFAGDSITEGYNTGTTLSPNPYVNRFAARLAAAFPLDSGSHPALAKTQTPTAYGSMSNGFNVINCGISSTNSGNYFTSTLRTAVGASNPRAVIHNIGTNDYRHFGTAVPTFKSNIQTVIADLKTKTAGPCVHILVHHFGTLTAESGKPIATWAAYGQAKEEIAAEDPENVAFIDLSGAFKSVGVELAGADPFDFLPDNTHPSNAGHAALGNLLYMSIFGGP